MVVKAPHKKFTTEQYYQMVAAGILTARDRVELIDGEIVQMSPMVRKHAACTNRLVELFALTFSSQACVWSQSPICLNEYSEPEPDIALLQRRSDFYLEGKPTPRDILALVEVSDATLEYDRTEKAPLYARAGIQELWIVNLDRLAIEIYRSPRPEGYQDIRLRQQGQSLSFQALPETTFTVEQLLAGFAPE